MAQSLTDPPDRMLDLGHTQLPYWRIGQGPDLVFVHGWPLHAGTWRAVVAALQADFSCHLIDLPGAGQSQWSPATPQGLAGLTECLAQAVALLPLSGPFTFIAHDSGAGIARTVAAEIPEQIHGLVMGNTEIPGHHPWRLRLLLAIARSPLRALLPLGFKSRLGRWLLLRDCVVDTRRIEAELTPLFLAPLLASERRMRGALAIADHLKASDFDAVGLAHPKLTAPVRLVWGARDPWFPLKHARRMVASFGGPCHLTVIDDAKLLVHEEHPERFAAEVRALFAPPP